MPGLPHAKILANWGTTSTFIYETEDSDELKSLLRHEVLHRNRGMIVDRLTVRLLSLMKLQNKVELVEDIADLEEVREREEH